MSVSVNKENVTSVMVNINVFKETQKDEKK